MADKTISEMSREMAQIISKAAEAGKLEVLIESMLTPGEIEGINRRWQLLRLLVEGMTQRDIQEKLGICLGKISRGSRMLKYDHPQLRDLICQIEAAMNSDNSGGNSGNKGI